MLFIYYCWVFGVLGIQPPLIYVYVEYLLYYGTSFNSDL